ncbi:MAG: hypothetical protein FWG10_08340 [Eubacteriaceae bacterium]|nr:hypothetical protein [Eubacteriaceae bacterium]
MKKSTKIILFSITSGVFAILANALYNKSVWNALGQLLFTIGPFEVTIHSVLYVAAYVGFFALQSALIEALRLEYSASAQNGNSKG